MADGHPTGHRGGAATGEGGPRTYVPPAFPVLHRLPFRLSLLIAVTVLPLVALLVFNHYGARRDALKAAGREAGRLARLAARNQEAAFAETQRLLDALAGTSVVLQGSGPERDAYLAEVLTKAPGIRDLHVVDGDGAAVASALPRAESAALRDGDCIARARTVGLTTVGNFRAGGPGGPTVAVARPLPGSDGPSGAVLGATLGLGWLAQYQRSLELPGESVLQVLDPTGITLLRLPEGAPGSLGRTHPAPALALELPLGEELPVVATDDDGVRRFFGLAPLVAGETKQGLMIVIGIPEESVVGPLDRALRLNLILTFVVLLVSLGVARIAGDRLILGRVRGLVLATRRLATTDLENLRSRRRVCQDPSEFGDLERSFDEMARAVEARVREWDGRKGPPAGS